MPVIWTEEQREVIESREKNLLVSAAAGSGKTAVLVQHILSRLMDPVHPVDMDQMLVVTFTRAAAGEMRERIAMAIDEILDEQPENSHLQKQRTLIAHAQISTIDSFCMWVVRNYFHELDIDPDFRLMDEGEGRLLQAEVLDELLEEWYEGGEEDFFHLVDIYAGEQSDKKLQELILSLYHFSQSDPHPDRWLLQAKETYANLPETLDEMPMVKEILHEEKRKLGQFRRMLQEGLKMALTDESIHPKYQDTLQADLGIVDTLLAATTFSELLLAWERMEFVRKPAKRKNNPPGEKEEYLSNLRDVLKEELNKSKNLYALGTPQEMMDAIIGLQKPMATLVDVTMDFARKFHEEKKKRNVADFSDVAHMALDLLEGPSPLAKEISLSFEEIIIDEYQDSNRIQEEILAAVSREWRGEYNRFFVGDVKQSIYRFRQACPEMFLEKYAAYANKEEDTCQKIDLSRNFRSRAQVLDATNHIFSQLMGEELGGISYTSEAALYPAADYPEAEKDSRGKSVAATEIFCIDSSTNRWEEKATEANVIADRIRHLVHPQTGMMLWDGKKKEYRRAQYRDIVILLRSQEGWGETLVQGLAAAGIPAVSQQKTGYFTAPEVVRMLNLLKILDNPRQDIPLMSVLVSPIGKFSDEEIAKIVAQDRALPKEEREIRGLYGVCQRSDTPKMKQFLSMVEHFRRLSSYLPIHELLDRIWEETGYLFYLQALPAGETRRANVEMLREKALTFEKTSYHGIFQFNRYMEQLQKYNVDYGEASTLSEQDNLVRLTTIHRSKGLEFPIVFVAGMGKSFNLMDTNQTVIFHEKMGIASDFIDPLTRIQYPTLFKRYLSQRMRMESKAEELRVLYVAMTRAKEKLILVGTDKISKTMQKKLAIAQNFSSRQFPGWYVSQASSYWEWIFMALARDQGEFEIYPTWSEEIFLWEAQRQIHYAEIVGEFLNLDSEKVYEKELYSSWKDWSNYLYPFASSTNMKGSFSVSELQNKNKAEIERLSHFSGSLAKNEANGVDYAKLGTAYHRLI